jgi:hypothetical protein
MWLFTRYGFFSAVCARDGESSRAPIDPSRIVVRGRRRDHLDALRSRFAEHIGDCAVIADAGTDYRYRMVVPKVAWTQLVADLASEIDYRNFTSAVVSHQGEAGRDYKHALNDTWRAMSELQRRE